MLALCDRFHCLPSQVLEEDAGVLRLLKIAAMGTPPQAEGGGYDG